MMIITISDEIIEEPLSLKITWDKMLWYDVDGYGISGGLETYWDRYIERTLIWKRHHQSS